MKKINNEATLSDNAAAIECTKVISIDAATKSLAVACLNLYNVEQQNLQCLKIIRDANINNNISTNAINKLNELLTPVTIKSLEVMDLIPNKKVRNCSVIERSSALVQYLHKLTQELLVNKWLCNNTQLLIEYQMGQNRKSGDIQMQIIYHFLQYLPQKNIYIIGPSLKNKLSYIAYPESKHSHFIAQYNTLYSANKSHTKYIFIKWLSAHHQLHHLHNIKKKNYADIADAFCQAIAWNNIHAR